MIGKVIEGRYSGASVNKLPDKNVLYIETEDGHKTALSKENIISIDDVTAEYPGTGKRVMLVLWNDFETSFIQLGVVSSPQSREENNPQNKTKVETNDARNKVYYLGKKIISQNDFLRLKELMEQEARGDALIFIRKTGIAPADAMQIIDNFDTLDFSKPQSLTENTTSNNYVPQDNKNKTQNNTSKNRGCLGWIILLVFL